MKIITADAFILDWAPGMGDEIMKKLERYGRVAYKSEDNVSDGSAERFIKMLIKLGHESVLEHVSVSCKFIVDRGVSHELVRHRIASFTQESTRYCNYQGEKFGGEITVIQPTDLSYDQLIGPWMEVMTHAEDAYMKLINAGVSPQIARSVLPNSLKTEVVMTANLREWRHFFKLRRSPQAHPQMREVANILFKDFREKLPIIFEDLDPYDSIVLKTKEDK